MSAHPPIYKEPKKRALVWIAAVVLVALAAVVAVYVIHHRSPVYVTDGSHRFNSNLADVEGKILDENRWVASEHQPFVSIAVMQTMTPGDKDPLDPNRTRHALEGAYLAQYQSNHPAGEGNRPGAPLVKLVLADEGSQESTAAQATAALLTMTGGADHLVAVTGLGISVATTERTVTKLGGRSIAMVGAVTTGDGLSDRTAFVRVAPTNRGEAAAAAGFFARRFGASSRKKVWLVKDVNPDDDYSTSLATNFPRALKKVDPGLDFDPDSATATYDTRLPAAQTALEEVGTNLCSQGADVVYFAGRGVDLRALLRGLGNRQCGRSSPVTVITGSDATQLVGQQDMWPEQSRISLYYTALAHPAAWDKQPDLFDPAAVQAFKGPNGFHARFPAEKAADLAALDDGWAIMYYDAFLTALDTVKHYYAKTNKLPSAGAVAQELNQRTVPGASGFICFDPHHDPDDKLVPIIQLTSQGDTRYAGVSSTDGAVPGKVTCPTDQ